MSKYSGGSVGVGLTRLGDKDVLPGDVTVDVEYSSINYKEGSVRPDWPGLSPDYPLIPEIDLVDNVTTSNSVERSAGDRVILNGWGLGEKHHGGFAGH